MRAAHCHHCDVPHVVGYTLDCPACQDRMTADARDLLSRMSVLSEARGVSFIPSGVGGGKHESTGTAGPGARDGDEDLFAQWARRFADSANRQRLPTLIRLAQHELALRTHRKPIQAGQDDEGNLQREDTWERDNRIVDWYDGIPAEEAAIMESASGTYCPASNIRKVRRRNDRDAEFGRRQAPRDQRRALARRLRAEGMSLRQIARELNVSLGTVQDALGDDEVEAA